MYYIMCTILSLYQHTHTHTHAHTHTHTLKSPAVPTDTTAPVERHTITSSAVGGGASEIDTVSFNQTNITLSGLDMGTEYLVVVVGVNSVGPGDSDDVSVSTIVDCESAVVREGLMWIVSQL